MSGDLSDLNVAERLKHLARIEPPWVVAGHVTVCGRPLDRVDTATVEEIKRLVAHAGKRRAAFAVCMTCVDRWNDRRSWAETPAEIAEQWVQPGLRTRDDTRGARVRETLWALGALVAAHQDEYETLLDSQQATVNLTARRTAAAQRNRRPPVIYYQ